MTERHKTHINIYIYQRTAKISKHSGNKLNNDQIHEI